MIDPYLYKDSSVLINKANLKDQDKLDEYESTMVQAALIGIDNMGIEITSTSDIFKIHKILFAEVYEWAGKKRTINIYKSEPILDGMSVRYTDHTYIEKDLERIDKEIFKTKWDKLSKEEMVKKIVPIISDLWRTHAFREGNTRTISVFLYLFMKKIGRKINSKKIGNNAKYFRNALVMASIDEYSEYQHLEKLLTDTIDSDSGTINKNEYKKINKYDVSSYKYNYHHIKDD